MSGSLITNVYVRTLFEFCNEKLTNIDEIQQNLKFLVNYIEKNADFKKLLSLDVFSINEKKIVVNEVLEKLPLPKLFKNFILYLVEENRIKLLPEIYKSFVAKEELNEGKIEGTVEGNLQDIPKEDMDGIKKYVKEKINLNPILTYKMNKELTGGYRVIVGDFLLDATLDFQLKRLKESILNDKNWSH
ncbi:MAG: ATP synthase F1 subunit delta [Oligoflexia bacterium]|nr:ATP synthase F1 subunit delta [Oligoflexia bacterium]